MALGRAVTRPLSSGLLALCSLVLVGMGGYFALGRPALLPEDARYIHASVPAIQSTLPGLARWLDKVFWVLGGYMVTAGVLSCYVAVTAFRQRAPGAWAMAALAGLTSIGLMTAINFLLDSEFKWLLMLLAGLWALALVLYWVEKLAGGAAPM